MKADSIPIVDISPFTAGNGDKSTVSREIHNACIHSGFFYVTGHGVDAKLQQDLEEHSFNFFSKPEEEKMEIRMSEGGRAWRGYFPIGDELTSGKPDIKEGLYFGDELGPEHPKVRANIPMHGQNLFPDDMPQFREVVLKYMECLTRLGHQLMEAIALSLDLPGNYFFQRYTHNPLILFRIFHYPPVENQFRKDPAWGVGEHTDYGVLTILKQDDVGGLQVKSKTGWIDAPPFENSFVCNIGDMLDRMTSGYYRSTPHRVINRSNKSRYSYPFFFDPNFDAEIKPIDLDWSELPGDDKSDRWDQQSVHEFQGTYGEYILGKVGKVFPQLKGRID